MNTNICITNHRQQQTPLLIYSACVFVLLFYIGVDAHAFAVSRFNSYINVEC